MGKMQIFDSNDNEGRGYLKKKDAVEKLRTTGLVDLQIKTMQ